MAIGKTQDSISKEDILSEFSETEILLSLFPGITQLPCLMHSPFRMDKHPSFSIYVSSKGHIMFKDHATGETGDVFDLCQRYWNCSFKEVLLRIRQLHATSTSLFLKATPIKKLTKLNSTTTSIKVKVRPWRDYDYAYWQSYGITPQWLKYAEIYPISHKFITKKPLHGKPVTYTFAADKYAYVYVERKEGHVSFKIYQPYNKRGFKWSSSMSDNVVSLWTKIPQKGDKLIICSSLKDSLCVSCNLHIPTICPQGEGYSFSDTAVNQLKQRFNHIYIAYDTDEAGIEDAKRLSIETGFPYIVPNLRECKDFSDFFLKYGKRDFISHISPYFIENQIKKDNLPY